jgi:hypothetical protein
VNEAGGKDSADANYGGNDTEHVYPYTLRIIE